MLADIDDLTEDGLWSVDLLGECPGGLGPNSWAQASLSDDDGDATFVSAAPPPAFLASLTQNAIGGQGFAPNDTVDIWVNTIPTDPPTETVGTDGEGQFWFNPPFDLLAGDTIIVADEVVERGTVIEDPLSIDIDYDALTAAGELPFGAEVHVRIQGNSCGTDAIVLDSDDGSINGLWSINLSGDCAGGLGGDAWAQVYLYDNDGDATMAHAARAPQIQGSAVGDAVSGSGFTADTQVDVWVNLNPVLDLPTASAITSSEGEFWFDQIALGSLDLVVGDTIVASDGVIERVLVLEGPLTIDMDYTSLSAIGKLPVGSAVQVQMNGNWCGADAFVADGDDGTDDGTWHVDLSGDCPSGLGPDANARVMLYDADFDATVAEARRAPQIMASEIHDWINGDGFAPDTTINVWINVSTADPPTASIVSDGEGSWGVNQPGDLVFGDVVTASDGVIERVLELEGPLSMLADFATLTAVGQLPPGATVRVRFHGQDCGTDHWVADGADGTEDGFWSVNASGQCSGGLGPNAGAHVLLYDVDADATVAGAGQPPTIQASETNGWVGGQGFLTNTNVDVWINVASSGPSTTTVMTDGDGNFFVDSSTTGGLTFGDVVEASDGLSHRYLMLEGPLSIGLDLDLLSAMGDLPTGEGVQVHASGPNCGTDRWVNDIGDGANDGFWFVDLSTICPDGFGGDWGSSVQFFDGDGDATVVETLPPPRISSSVTADWIEGYNLDPNTPAKVYVNGDLVTTIGTDSGGGFYVESPGLGGIDLVLGDVVMADDDFKPKTLSLDGPMTIDVAAPQATASGQLPTGARVFFSLFNSTCGDFYNLQVDDGGDGTVDGLWEIDLSGDCPAGFGTGWDAQVDRYDSDGDATIVMWVPPGDSDIDGLSNAEERNIYGTDPGDDDSDDDGLLDGAEVNTHTTDPNDDDSDNDGLLDGAEVNTHGTKPLKADTDGDGLTDGAEVNTHGTKPLKADTDGDGLTDGAEVNTHGTKPLKADTDGDGLTDGAEVNTHGTKPLKADTDGDGLTDGAEVNTHGTKPLKADTDGDGLTDGAEVNTHGTKPLKADTDGDGLTDGAEVNTHGTKPLKADTDGDGLTDGAEVNTHGTKPLKADTDGDGLTDGAEVNTHGTKPLKADTDGDGLTDGAEVNTHGTKPLKADTDGDGLTDGAEVNTHGTKPLKADTDGDGLTDGAEVNTHGTKPLKADTDGDGLTDGAEVNTHGTKPLKADTDGGTVNDGDEIAAGTDPLNPADDLAGPPIESVVPARLLETRSGPDENTVDRKFEGIGPRAAGSTLELKVTDRGGVPADADAVMLNVTAVFPDAPGFLTLFPCGSALPLAANVNYIAGDVVPNAVLAKIGTGGKVCIYTSAATHIVADVNGYVPSGGAPATVVPARLLETRSGPDEKTVDRKFEGIGPRAAGSTLELKVTDRGGVPADADAVMLNVTAVFPDAPGFLTLFPCGSALPLAANVNYIAGDVVPNAVLAKIGTGGKVCIYTSAATHIVADVNGYVPSGGAPATVVPARLLETRSGPDEKTVDRKFEGIGPRAAGSTLELKVTDRGGVPADADAVMLNVTAVFPDAPGFLTLFPCGSALPLAANVNYIAGDVVPNAVLAKIGTGGKVCIYTSAATHIVADVNGYVP